MRSIGASVCGDFASSLTLIIIQTFLYPPSINPDFAKRNGTAGTLWPVMQFPCWMGRLFTNIFYASFRMIRTLYFFHIFFTTVLTMVLNVRTTV